MGATPFYDRYWIRDVFCTHNTCRCLGAKPVSNQDSQIEIFGTVLKRRGMLSFMITHCCKNTLRAGECC